MQMKCKVVWPVLLRERNFLILSIAAFTSNFGSVTLLMSLSLKSFDATGSSVLAGSIYASQWLIPLIFLPAVDIARSALPIGQLGLSINIATFAQALMSLAVVAGVVSVAQLMKVGDSLNRALTPQALTLLTALCMSSSVTFCMLVVILFAGSLADAIGFTYVTYSLPFFVIVASLGVNAR